MTGFLASGPILHKAVEQGGSNQIDHMKMVLISHNRMYRIIIWPNSKKINTILTQLCFSIPNIFRKIKILKKKSSFTGL